MASDHVGTRGDSSRMASDKLTIYIPKAKRERDPVDRLNKLAKQKDRSVNYLVVKALEEFVEREETNSKKG